MQLAGVGVDIGDIIKDYQIIEHIGRGGMADVWSARDSKLNRMVAVKTIAHGLSPDGDPMGMFKREAQTIANLEHPNILPIYDFGQHQGSLYIVMRYVSGGSLSAWMERGTLPLEDGLRVMTAMAQALDYAHDRGVVHLDLKPQNILLDSHKAPYLADFGLATALDPQGRAANPGSGTLLYMAPEQLTSDLLDKRSDIYSFAIMAFHILNGSLPFDGLSPMVMKQLQFQQELPDIPSLPPSVSEILRRSAALNPVTRHASLIEMVDELRSAFSLAPAYSLSSPEPIPGVAPELQEAVAIYQRARAAWDGGNGRFVLGVTDFLVMETTYTDAESKALELDNFGRQMLLRGALEYGINVEKWLETIDASSQRWVCLHAVRSANAPARIRAMKCLETLPDDEPPRIPRLIAQALQVETDDEAKLAALSLLAARASRRTMSMPMLPELTQTVSRALMTLARVETRELPPDEWLPTAYGPEVDLLIAEIALDLSQPHISEAAARTVASIRSEAAVKYLADQQRDGRKGALRALALVRDQAPNLPDTVSPGGRFYAWAANSLRRMTASPLSLTWRFIFAVIGASLARGWQMWTTFDLPVNVLQPQRIANTVAYGLAFGTFVGVMVLLADEIPSRLRGFWKWPLRAAFAFGFGVLAGALTWAIESYMFLQLTDFHWDLMLFGGFGLAAGFAFNSLLNLRAWSAVLLTAILVYMPVFAAYNNYCTQQGVCLDSPAFSVGPVAGVGLLIGLFCGTILRLQTGSPRFTLRPFFHRWHVAYGFIAGLLWAALIPLTIQPQAADAVQEPMRWMAVFVYALLGLIPGLVAGYIFNWSGRAAFTLASVLAFVVILIQVNPQLQANGPFPVPDSLFYMRFNFMTASYENSQIFYATIPFALLIAIGGHAQLISREIREWLTSFRARRVVVETPNYVTFINTPRAIMPDTATMLDGVRKAREDLAAAGHTDLIADAPTMQVDLEAGTVIGIRQDIMPDVKTAPIESNTQAEIRRAQESDK